MMSIQKKGGSGKGKKKDISLDSIGEGESHHATILLLLLFIFSSLSSFALGRLSVIAKEGQRSLVIETVPPDFVEGDTTEGGVDLSSGQSEKTVPVKNPFFLVGSKNSDKYHFPWCSGARRIKPENIVSFSSYEEARNAGYTPASNCDGLQ
jgi:hypothetical protein